MQVEGNMKIDSNEEFVSKLIKDSFHGQLTGVFVIEALRFYAERVASTPRPEASQDNGVVSAIIWHDIATAVSARLEQAYGTSIKETNV